MMNRRTFLQTATGVAVGSELSSVAFGQVCPAGENTVRDRIWVFANPVNADIDMVQKRSVMSPLEAAVYLGAPNLLIVSGGQEARESDVWSRPERSAASFSATSGLILSAR